MPAGPLATIHANIMSDRMASAQKSARRDQTIRRPGTGRKTTHRGHMRSAHADIRGVAAGRREAQSSTYYTDTVPAGYSARRDDRSRKPGTGRETPLCSFRFSISDRSRQEAARAVREKHTSLEPAGSAVQRPSSSHSAHNKSEPTGDNTMLAIRDPPSVAASIFAGSDMQANMMAIRAPPAVLENMLSHSSPMHGSPASSHGQSEHSDSSENEADDMGGPSDAESIAYSSEAQAESGAEVSLGDTETSVISQALSDGHETTMDPDEQEEQIRLQLQQEMDWAKPPEQELRELDAQDAQAEQDESSVDLQASMTEAADTGLLEQGEDENVNAGCEAVITPPAEPSPQHGVRRSRRRKFSPLAFWKNERVTYKRRLSAACLDVLGVQKISDAVTPYKRRKLPAEPLAILDRQ